MPSALVTAYCALLVTNVVEIVAPVVVCDWCASYTQRFPGAACGLLGEPGQAAVGPSPTSMKFAGGATRLWAEMDQGEFIRQIQDYEDADRSNLSRAYKMFLTAWRTHPFPILRAKELDAWYGTGYADLVETRALPV